MLALERHYDVQQVAEMWNVSASTVRELFQDESGVVKIGGAETRFKRKWFTLRIPESAVIRVHERLRNKK